MVDDSSAKLPGFLAICYKGKKKVEAGERSGVWEAGRFLG